MVNDQLCDNKNCYSYGYPDCTRHGDHVCLKVDTSLKNNNVLLEDIRTYTQLMVSIAEKKNADYAGVGGDPFSNFTKVQYLGIASTEQGFLTRMNDKFSRLISFVSKGFLKVSDETVEDTLLDLANYCLIMASYLKRKKMQEGPSNEEVHR